MGCRDEPSPAVGRDPSRAGWPEDVRLRLATVVPGIEDLMCPVRGEPPVSGDAEWSHTDGTPLCADSDPVEAQ